jgi:hypothetical protein
MSADFSKLTRSRQAMPSFVREAWEERSLMAAYRGPAYQQNDYDLFEVVCKRVARSHA